MNKKDKKFNFIILVLVLGTFIIVNAVFLLLPDVLNILNTRLNDQLFKLRINLKGTEPVWDGGSGNGGSLITMIELGDIGYDKIKQLKQYYGDRIFDADIINILGQTNVSAIGYDTVFSFEGDQSLLDATIKAGNVFYPVIFAPGTNSKLSNNLKNISDNFSWNMKTTGKKPDIWTIRYSTKPELVENAKGVGHININSDSDGIFRRAPLLIHTEEGFFPSLSLSIAANYLDVKPGQIEVDFGNKISLKNAKFPDGHTEDIEIPIDSNGQTTINFAGNWLDVYNHISFSDMLEVLEDEDLIDILRDNIENNIIVVADVSSAGKDFEAVPLENFYPLSNVHANVINSILTKNFIYELGTIKQILLNIIIAIVLCIAAIKFSAIMFTGASFTIFIVFILFVIFSFVYNNTLMSILPPALSIIFSFVFISLFRFLKEEQERAFLFQTFEHYFAPSVLNKILKDPGTLESSERKVLTIMFSDISGFTAWSSTREPEEIHSTLNEYFSEMARIVFKYEGTIDKYMGDGMLAFFGDPIEYDDHALRGVKVAVEMQQKARELRKQWKDQGKLQIEMRIGINTGPVVVGNMGSENRIDYTVLGSEVNLAQRLEANAPIGGILITKSVNEDLKKEEDKDSNKTKDIKTTLFGNINVKGLEDEIEVYEVEVSETDS